MKKQSSLKSARGHARFEKLEGRQMMSATAATASPVRLGGTAIGTAGSWGNIKADTIASAFDGNLNTFFDAPTANGGWAGLDLGAPQQVTQVRFAPRSDWAGFANRMVGGVFQGSNTPDFSAGVTTLYTVTTAPATRAMTAAAVTVGGTFRYVRYLSPTGGYGDVAELEFDGPAAAVAVPVVPAVPAAPTGLSATATAGGVLLSWTPDPSVAADSFTVKRQGPGDAGYATLTTVAGTSFVDATAAASTAYSYVVVANNAGGVSAASAAAAVTTAAAAPWTDADIGAPALAGSASVSPGGAVTVSGGGADIWGQTDQFNYQSQPLAGNGSVVAQVTAQTNSNGWAKSGVMIRESANADSRAVLLALTPGNGITLQARSATHSTPGIVNGTVGTVGVWLKLARSGSTFTGSYSTDGAAWTVLGSVTVPMVNNVLGGLAVTAHDNTKLCTATFANVAVTSSATAASAWINAATAPLSRWEAQNFTCNGKLYAFGGFVDRTLDATTAGYVYDPAAGTWAHVTDIPVTGGLTHAAVTVVGDMAYFAGGDVGTFTHGRNSTTSTAAVLTYNVTTNTWGTTTPLPAAGSCAGLVCINHTLYYYGGLNATDTADLTNTWALDLSNPGGGWVAKAAMPNARDHIGAVAINGIAYAVGGGHLYNQTQGNDAEVDAYDPATDTWTRVASLPVPNSSIETSTLVANGKIVVVGGQTNGGYDGIYQNTVLAYDPTTNRWSQVATLPEASQSASVAYVNGQLIVANGTVDNQGGWAQNQTWVNGGIVI